MLRLTNLVGFGAGGIATLPPPAANPVPIDTSVADGTGTSIVISPPTNIADDLLLILYVTDGAAETHTTPAGYTAVLNSFRPGGVTISIYRKISDGAEGDVTLTTNSTELQMAGMISIRGVDTTTPLDVEGTTNSGTDVSCETNGVTTTVNDTLLVAMVGSDFGTRTFTPPAGMSDTPPNGIDHNSGSSGGASGSIATAVQAAAGASGDKIFTLNAAEEWGTFMVAVKPAP